MKLYEIHASGNCYRVRLMLALLGRAAEFVEMDHHALRAEEFRALNPLGEVPVLVDGDVRLRDSQAILVYLARAYGVPHWLPSEPATLARIQQWLSFAANEIQYGPRVARAIVLFGIPGELAAAQEKARHVLAAMESSLRGRVWLETGQPTVADVACYPYVSRASDAAIDIAAYPHLGAWLKRVEALPGFVAL